MAVAIEDAGFEIRDQIMWVYGSGFPKSHNIGKAVDKLGANPLGWIEFSTTYKQIVEESKYNHNDIDKHLAIKASSCYWARIDHRGGLPPRHHWEKIKLFVGLDNRYDKLYDETEREILGQKEVMGKDTDLIYGKYKGGEVNITKGTSPYEGWGTALKPAHEPIVVARKPLSEKTIALNVLKWGTGGINIEKSRVFTQADEVRKQKILAGEVSCNAFCDKHESYPSSLSDILSFSRLQLHDFYQHIFSELGSYSNSYTNLLHNLEVVDYKNYKQLLGVPYDCGLLEERVNEYVHVGQEVLNSQSDYPTLSRLYDVFVHCQKVSDQDVFPLSNDVQVDILHFLSSKENNQLNDNNPLLAFVLALLAYSFLVNNNLHNHYTTCKNKSQGRFPANFCHDGSDEVVGLFPETKSGGGNKSNKLPTNNTQVVPTIDNTEWKPDSGSASRFFYCAKASKKDRNEGLEGFEVKQTGSFEGNADTNNTNRKIGADPSKPNEPRANNHPTVKPTSLMQYLVRLVTPKGGTVLDPFAGSGSTGKACVLEGFDFIGIELESDYCKIAEARINHTLSSLDPLTDKE